MALPSLISRFQSGFRLVSGESLNTMVDAINQGLLNYPGNKWYVSPAGSNRSGKDWASSYNTIQSAITAAAAGDMILIAPGDYVEEVTITKSNLLLVGLGPRGSVSVAPNGANDTGITVNDCDSVTLINVGGAGAGTGVGCHVLGDVARFTAFECKFEGGAAALRLESDAGGAVADTRIIGCELAWSAIGLDIQASGGGDPVTQTLVQNCLFQNITDDGVLVGATHTADAWIIDNTFANQEDASEPTQYIDMDTANTTGLVSGNVFATTVLAAAKMAIAAGVIWAGNQCQAEGPATGGGTAGRPD